MNLGSLDRRITLQNYTATQSDYGESIPTYSTLATVWAMVKPINGNESVTADKITVKADCLFTIRYRTSVTEKTRIVYNSVNYDITNISEVGRRKYLELTAKKVQ